MNSALPAPLPHSGTITATEGEFAGWSTWSRERAGGSLVFLRGLMSSAGRPLLSFSGTIKRLKKRS